MRQPALIFFDRDQGMAFFLGFLVLMTIFVPMVSLSRPARVAVGIIFALTFVSGAIATIHHRVLMLVVIVLSISAFATVGPCKTEKNQEGSLLYSVACEPIPSK